MASMPNKLSFTNIVSYFLKRDVNIIFMSNRSPPILISHARQYMIVNNSFTQTFHFLPEAKVI